MRTTTNMFAKRDETSNCSTYSNPSAAVGRALKGLSALKSDQASQQHSDLLKCYGWWLRSTAQQHKSSHDYQSPETSRNESFNPLGKQPTRFVKSLTFLLSFKAAGKHSIAYFIISNSPDNRYWNNNWNHYYPWSSVDLRKPATAKSHCQQPADAKRHVSSDKLVGLSLKCDRNGK